MAILPGFSAGPVWRRSTDSSYQAGVETNQHRLPIGARSSLVVMNTFVLPARRSVSNMAPLFHFWGINPSGPELADELSSLPNSPEIRQLIMDYWQNVAPQDFNDYLSYHNQMYDRTGYQQPRYDQYLIDFDAEIVHGHQLAIPFPAGYLLWSVQRPIREPAPEEPLIHPGRERGGRS